MYVVRARFLDGTVSYFLRSFAIPAIPKASMKSPPKSGVASMRPVREYASTTASRLKPAAANASQTASFCVGVDVTSAD